MSPSEFKNFFDDHFSKEVDRLIKRATSISSNLKVNGIIKHIKSLSENGKRLRPYILYLGYGKEKVDAKIINQMIGVELLHLFALIHDDIMDGSEKRHGVKTIQKLVKEDNLGKSFAMLFGDMVFNWSYEIFLKNNLNQKSKEIFSLLIEEVIVGQSVDAYLSTVKNWSKKELDEKTLLKTARYTFRRPLEIGLALREEPLDKKVEKIYSQIGENMGIVFQIDDDLLDIFGDEKKLKKKTFQDIESNQATLISFYLKTNKSFKGLVGKRINQEEKVNLKKLITDSGTLSKIEEERCGLIKSTENMIAELEGKEVWMNFLNKITQREK